MNEETVSDLICTRKATLNDLYTQIDECDLLYLEHQIIQEDWNYIKDLILKRIKDIEGEINKLMNKNIY